MRVLLGIPTSGAPTQPFLESLAGIALPPDVELQTITVTGNFISAQRELIVERALEMRADALLMCDDDMVLPPDAFKSLLGLLQNDTSCGLAGALYYSRDGFRPMVVDDWSSENTTTATIPAFDQAPVRVGGVGFGCVAISATALRLLSGPIFETQVYIERNPPRVRICNEDYLFCAKLRSIGYDVILHAGVRCGHYDRASGIVYPVAWEGAAATSQRRIAALVGGGPALVPFSPMEPRGERHVQAPLTYVYPTA